jgi:hypothetical protein
MASTFSPSLKLTLMGDGDQAGLWGQTTNTNLGTLIEQAITGVQSITMSDANYTLTSFNGVTDEARNAVLVVTGTNNAVRDLIPPVVEKLYIIANNTTGGFAIRVIGVSGTGVNIPNGTTQVVYCDGANFIAASAAFTNGSVLSVSGGGTGLSTLTANNVILGNGTSSPTFVAPGTTGNVLTSNGSTWASTAPSPEFASGTRMTFNQTNAPTGWTKSTSVDNAGFRLVSGSVSSGGSVDFSTAFASQTPTGSVSISSISGSAGATTLSIPQIPSHNHPGPGGGCSNPIVLSANYSTNPSGSGDPAKNVFAQGGGGAHSHPFSFSSGSGTFSGSSATVVQNSHNHTQDAHNHTASSSFTGNAINLAVQYIDVIRATKD